MAIRLLALVNEPKPRFALYQALKVSLKDSIILLEISSLKDCTLMCLGLGKTALTATLYDQYLSVTIQAGVPYFLALQKSVKAWEELV